MPTGKLGPTGGYARAKPLSYSVSIRSLRRTWAREGTKPLAKAELRELRRSLRSNVRLYRIALLMPTTTATVRRKMLAKIRTAASRFAATTKKSWAERLLASFAEIDPNTQAVIHRELWRRGFHWKSLPTMKRQLGELFRFSIYPEEPFPEHGKPSRAQLDRATRFIEACWPTLEVLAELDVKTLVPKKGKWANPAQANLIAALEPIWCRVTGRTAGLVSANVEGAKRCMYAEWLRRLLDAADLPAPPEGTVVDVVRPKNRKIGHPRTAQPDG